MRIQKIDIIKYIRNVKLPVRIDWSEVPKIVTTILLMLPILSQYRFWPIASFGVAELACVVLSGGYIGCCFLFREKIKFGPFFAFYALSAIGVVISAPIYGESFISMVLSVARLVLLYLAFFCAVPQFFDYQFARRWYVRLALAASAGVFAQVILQNVFHQQLYLILPNMTLNYGGGMNSSELIASLVANVESGYMYRPSSFFIEPAYLSAYVLPCIGILLFEENQDTRKNLIAAAVLSVAMLLTTSTISLVITMAVWGLYFVLTLWKLPKDKRRNFLLVACGAAVVVLAVVLLQGDVRRSLLRKINQIFSLGTATRFNSTSMRLLRGFYFYGEMGWLPKLIGCGFSHIADYYHLADIQLALDYEGLQVDYMNSFSAILCSSGLVGAACYWTAFVKLTAHKRRATIGLITVFLLLMISSSFLNTPDYFLVLAFLMTLCREKNVRTTNRLKKNIKRGSILNSTKPEGVKIGVVVLNYNNSSDTIAYVKMIREYQSIDHIVIVDNCSTDDSVQQMKEIACGKVELIESGRNGGYGYGNNCGIRYLREKYGCKYILITNPDVQYKECVALDCARFLHDHEQEGYAVVAPTMVNLDGTIGETAWPIPKALNYYMASMMFMGKFFTMESVDIITHRGNGFVPCDCVAGSMLMVNSDRFAEAGMYDEDIFLFCEETTIGIRLKRLGYRTAVLPDSYFIHAHSTSINKSITSRVNRLKIMWKSRLHVLETYYNYHGIRLAFAKMIMEICLLETKVVAWLKKLLKR